MDKRALLEFVGLTIVWPALAYTAATWGDVMADGRPTLAVLLAVSGMLTWVWRNH